MHRLGIVPQRLLREPFRVPLASAGGVRQDRRCNNERRRRERTVRQQIVSHEFGLMDLRFGLRSRGGARWPGGSFLEKIIQHLQISIE